MSGETSGFIKWGTFVGGIATAVALCFLAWQAYNLNSQVDQQRIQTNILQNDFNENTRPYLGIMKIEEYENNKVWFVFQNFGKIPNKDGLARIAIGSMITREDLNDTSKPKLPIGVVLPSQAKSQKLLGLPESYMIKAKSGVPLYIGILLQYNYTDGKEGEYGVITIYDNSSNAFDIEDNWVK